MLEQLSVLFADTHNLLLPSKPGEVPLDTFLHRIVTARVIHTGQASK